MTQCPGKACLALLLLLAWAPWRLTAECGEADASCQAGVDDASLLSLHRLQPKQDPPPAISSSKRAKTPQRTGGEPSPSTVAGAELYTSGSYKYGKFEARIQYAGQDGVISSFFLWKPESERPSVFWNELDFEKAGTQEYGPCKLTTNLLSGIGDPVGNEETVRLRRTVDICGSYHTYAFEWTPGYARWTVDGLQIRRMDGPVVQEFNQNAGEGMQFRFNVWPGDSTFGGNFSAWTLPLYQYIDWVRYYGYSDSGGFVPEWQEDFDASNNSLPSGWLAGDWTSPKGYSRHRPQNIVITRGNAVLALTRTSSPMPTPCNVPCP